MATGQDDARVKRGLVTIVIPTYNDDPDHLTQAVDSAKRQTYEPIEIIVVDDGSTRAGTVATVDDLTEVKVVRQTNTGLPGARNAGIRQAGGEFILPLDADNWIEPDSVERLVGVLSVAGDEVVAAYPRVMVFGAQEGELPLPSEVGLGDLAVRNYIDASALFRRADWERVDGYTEQSDAPEDWILWIEMLNNGGRMIHVPGAVLHYRLRSGSLNTRYDDAEAGLRQVAEAAGGNLAEMYVAAALQAQGLLREMQELRPFYHAWAPRVRPVLRVRDAGRRFARRLNRVLREDE